MAPPEESVPQSILQDVASIVNIMKVRKLSLLPLCFLTYLRRPAGARFPLLPTLARSAPVALPRASDPSSRG